MSNHMNVSRGLVGALALILTGCGSHGLVSPTAIKSQATTAKTVIQPTAPAADQAGDTKGMWWGTIGANNVSANFIGSMIQGQFGQDQISAQGMGHGIGGWVRHFGGTTDSFTLNLAGGSVTGFIGGQMAMGQFIGNAYQGQMIGNVGNKQMTVYLTTFGATGSINGLNVSMSGQQLQGGQGPLLEAFLLAVTAFAQ